MSYIETERLLLRTWMAADVPALAAMYGDSETMQYILSGTKTAEQTRIAIDEMVEANERDGCSMWPLVLKESSELIGSCGLMKTKVPGELELGFILAPHARGKGYAVESARAVLAFGFEHLNPRSIMAFVHPFNAPSIAVLNKVGMQFDRLMRVQRGQRGGDFLRYVRHG
jgi:[ribosomal protein S5]-alanine N-acetyltransferase